MLNREGGGLRPNLRLFRRYQIMAVGFLAIIAIIFLQLFRIQIIDHSYYVKQANSIHLNKSVIPATRGSILVQDADGNIAPLVMNRMVYTLFADPSAIDSRKNIDKVKALVNRVVGDKLINGSLDKLKNKKSQYVVLAKQISGRQAAEIKKAGLYGLGMQNGTLRVYPEGGLAAQVLGFVNHDGKGQYGVEQYYNKELSGQNGELRTATDVSRIPLTIGPADASRPAVNGKDLVLSIDRNVQSQAEQVLAEGIKRSKATTGSLLVMDPQTGRVLAMANLPSYNPAEYSKTPVELYQNRIISNAYEPGSIMKVFTVGMGLNEGVISPSSTFYNTSCIQIDDAEICNVDKAVSGQRMTPMQLLEYSLNTGAVWVLNQLGGGHNNLAGRRKFHNYLLHNYRLGKKTGIDLASEVGSVIHPPNSPNGARVLYSNMTFGQGEQLTMIQVAAAFSAVLNGGNYYNPTILKGFLEDGKLKEKSPELIAKNVLKPSISDQLKEMIYQARYYGAGGKHRDNGYYIGGKSGTAEKVNPKTFRYYDDQNIGSYMGFGADKTKRAKYVIMVRVDDAHNGGYSGSAAAQPIFDSMNNFMIQYEGLTK